MPGNCVRRQDERCCVCSGKPICGARRTSPCVKRAAVLRMGRCECRTITWENPMTWKTPKIVEVPVGMEINMYACAARK